MSTQRTRLTTSQAEEIRQIVLGCILANRTVNETMNIIDRRLHAKLAVDTIKHLRMEVKRNALDELRTMQVDNDVYIYEYLKDIQQIKNIIKEEWNLADLALQNKDYDLRRQCLNDIATHTIILHKLYDFLPSACSMKIFSNELIPQVNYGNNKLNIK